MRGRPRWWRWNRDDIVVLILTAIVAVAIITVLAATHVLGIL